MFNYLSTRGLFQVVNLDKIRVIIHEDEIVLPTKVSTHSFPGSRGCWMRQKWLFEVVALVHGTC